MAPLVKTRLSVNLNKVALLRNQRDVGYPDVVSTARMVIAAGAAGITVHPRPDERHIRRTDVYELGALLGAEYDRSVEFNIEGNPTEAFLALALDVHPTQVTLVPDTPEQRTSDHGWDFTQHRDFLHPVVARLVAAGIRVAIFVDPDFPAVEGAADIGAQRVELYTEPYAAAYATGQYRTVLESYVRAVQCAVQAGLGINAGHDLSLDNLREFRAVVPALDEVSIGHAIIADALKMGFPAAVKAYLAALA